MSACTISNVCIRGAVKVALTAGLMFGSLIMLAGCSSGSHMPEQANGCEEPRPQMCTREYRPVCGVQGNSLSKTYGNACSACADDKVVYMIQGACQGKKPRG